MKIRAQFERKRLQYDLYDCEIEAVRILKKDVFYTFQHSLLSDYDFLAKYAEAMRIDSNDVAHTVLVLGEELADGILVNSEGSSYARYSCYVPGAKSFFENEIRKLADYCISEYEENSRYLISTEELYCHFGAIVSADNGIGEALVKELQRRDAIANVIMTEDGLEITNSMEQTSRPKISDYEKEYEPFCTEDIDIIYANHILWINDVGGKQADFSGKEIHDVDFSYQKLNNVNFRNAKLVNCKFIGAQLCFADFSGTVLQNCEMNYLSVDEMDMSRAYLENCDLSYLIVCHCNFAETQFVHCQLFNGKTHRCCFENANFYHTKTKDSYIDPVNDSISEDTWLADNGITPEMELK